MELHFVAMGRHVYTMQRYTSEHTPT